MVQGKDGKWYGPGESYEDQDGNVQFVPGGNATPAPASGDQFGADMRKSAMTNHPMLGVNHDAINVARGTASDSYGKQQGALGLLRASAMGQGPGVAAQQGQAGQDQALMALLRNRGQPMLPGAGGNIYGAGNAAAQARGKEIGAAQGAWGSGASTMRGQSLQDLSQAQNAGYGAQNNYMNQQQQNIERQLRLQGLSQQGYNMENAYRNEQSNIQAGFYGDELARQQQQTAAAFNMFGSGAAALSTAYGSQPQGGGGDGYDPNAGIYRNSPY